MTEGFLESRRVALEESFFAKQNEKLLQKLREKAATQAKKEAIASAIGIADDTVLDQLVEAGLCGETAVALYLVPLIEVAWADGEIQRKERGAVIRAAEEQGIKKTSIAHQLLENWLDQPIDPSLMKTWEDFVGGLRETIDANALVAMKQRIVGQARAVAEAAGGFLAIGKISAKEKAMLARLEGAFGD